MAQINGLKALFNAKTISNIANVIEEKVSNKTLQSLQYIGEQFVNDARIKGNYTDRTGNLRSSIGYIILKDGVIIDRNFEGNDKGQSQGYKVATEIGQQNTKGYVLIGVAGMEYAAYVENRHHLDVISGSAPTKQVLKSILSEIKF